MYPGRELGGMRTIQRKLGFTQTSPYARKVHVYSAIWSIPRTSVAVNPFEDVTDILEEVPRREFRP